MGRTGTQSELEAKFGRETQQQNRSGNQMGQVPMPTVDDLDDRCSRWRSRLARARSLYSAGFLAGSLIGFAVGLWVGAIVEQLLWLGG